MPRKKPPMATKRKSPKKYATGGAVVAESDPSAVSAIPPPDPASDDAVRRAAEAVKYAETLQNMTVEQYIDHLPDLSDHKRAFLKKFPLAMQEDNARSLARHRQAALAAGVADDTEEMDRAMLDGFAADLRAQRERLTPSDMIARPPEIEKVAPDPVAEEEALKPFIPPSGLPPPLPHAGPSRGREKGIAYSAPVSREVPSYSGKRMSETRSITLSPLEREIARNSFGPIQGPNGELKDMTPEAKERLYAQKKQELLAKRASGEYRHTTEQGGG